MYRGFELPEISGKMAKMLCYQERRSELAKRLQDGLIVCTAAPEVLRNGDVHYDYRQDSNFLYLTGITQPGYALVIEARSRISHLFIPDIDLHHQVWVGRQLGLKEAKTRFGTHQVHFMSRFKQVVQGLLKQQRKIHALPSAHGLLSAYGLRGRIDNQGLSHLLAEMRVCKSAAEIACLRRANRIARAGHQAAMAAARPGMYEYQIQAILEREFRILGATHNAYPSIVAAGANSAVLHYHDNNARLRPGDLLLIDAGAECQGYASDVTRTFPVSGRFSRDQRQIYDIVLETQKACIRRLRPGIPMIDIHNLACRYLTEGLMRVGILKGKNPETVMKAEAHRLFFPHGIGHLLGLDVHDVGDAQAQGTAFPVGTAVPLGTRKKQTALRMRRRLEEDFVVTVEPGIYFIAAHLDNPRTRRKFAPWVDWRLCRRYRSVGGIRIEDDVLITAAGHQNLTTVPKERAEIAALLSARPSPPNRQSLARRR